VVGGLWCIWAKENVLQLVSACALGCSSFYFAKGWHFVCRFTVHFCSHCRLLGLLVTGSGIAEVEIEET